MVTKKKVKKEKVKGGNNYRQSKRMTKSEMSKGILGLIVNGKHVCRDCATTAEVNGPYYGIYFGGKVCTRCDQPIGENPLVE